MIRKHHYSLRVPLLMLKTMRNKLWRHEFTWDYMNKFIIGPVIGRLDSTQLNSTLVFKQDKKKPLGMQFFKEEAYSPFPKCRPLRRPRHLKGLEVTRVTPQLKVWDFFTNITNMTSTNRVHINRRGVGKKVTKFTWYESHTFHPISCTCCMR